MKKRWDEALRSLARRSQGPFRVLAYGVSAAPDGEADLVRDLGNLLRGEGRERDGEIVGEVADPFSNATRRPLFRSRVLPWVKSAAPPRASGPSSAAARRDLESVAADLSGFLRQLDGDAAGSRPPFMLLPDSAPPRATGETPLLVVRQFEDLGCDAEGIAGALEAVVLRGGHVAVASEGLDTRTREGRGLAGLAIRLGGIKSAQARERSLRDLRRRREGLEVYGPVPFGFTRRGQGLVPVADQMETVARARELSRRGISLLETALALNHEQRFWKDGTPWTGRRVRQVLQNRIYDRSLQGALA